MSPDDAHLLDCWNAASRAIDFLGSADRESFRQDARTQSAVLHQLILLGEAVKRLSSELRQRNPDIPWKAIAGMRDKLVHEYDDVDLELVWSTLKKDLPDFRSRLSSILPRVP